jgi:hypothetical protein
MVFGNRNEDSGTGVVTSRNRVSHEAGLDGEFKSMRQGEDIVQGVVIPDSVEVLRQKVPYVYYQLEKISQVLEAYFGNVQNIEFTIENGELKILQTTRAPPIEQGESFVSGALPIAQGTGCGRGAFVGRVVFSPERIEVVKKEIADYASCAGLLDLTLLTRDQAPKGVPIKEAVEKLAGLAVRHKTAGICLYPEQLAWVKDIVKGSGTAMVAVIAFPRGLVRPAAPAAALAAAGTPASAAAPAASSPHSETAARSSSQASPG